MQHYPINQSIKSQVDGLQQYVENSQHKNYTALMWVCRLEFLKMLCIVRIELGRRDINAIVTQPIIVRFNSFSERAKIYRSRKVIKISLGPFKRSKKRTYLSFRHYGKTIFLLVTVPKKLNFLRTFLPLSVPAPPPPPPPHPPTDTGSVLPQFQLKTRHTLTDILFADVTTLGLPTLLNQVDGIASHHAC